MRFLPHQHLEFLRIGDKPLPAGMARYGRPWRRNDRWKCRRGQRRNEKDLAEDSHNQIAKGPRKGCRDVGTLVISSNVLACKVARMKLP